MINQTHFLIGLKIAVIILITFGAHAVANSGKLKQHR